MLPEDRHQELVEQLLEARAGEDVVVMRSCLHELLADPEDAFVSLGALAAMTVGPTADDVVRVTVYAESIDGTEPTEAADLAASVVAAFANDDHEGAWMLLEEIGQHMFFMVFGQVLTWASIAVAKADAPKDGS